MIIVAMRKIVLLFVSFCAAVVSPAGNLRQVSSREGISNNAVQALAQDSNGFVWLGTCDGLNMWDGNRMYVFQRDDTGDSYLSGNLIEEIAVTRDSLFWIRTNYGLDLFNPQTYGVEKHQKFRGMYRIAARNRDEVIVVGSDGLWSTYDPEARDFVAMDACPDISYSDYIDGFIDDNDSFWVFSRKGVFRYPVIFGQAGGVMSVGTPSEYFFPGKLQYTFVGERIFLIDDKGIMYEFDTSDGHCSYISDISREIAERGYVSGVISDGADYIVSFSTNGCIRLKSITYDKERFRRERMDIHCGVMSLLKDRRQDIVWIGTDGQGLYQDTKNQVSFSSVTFDKLPYSLSKPVRSLFVDRTGALWIATKGEGILKINRFYDQKQYRMNNTVQYMSSNSELLENSIYAFAESSRDIIWIAGDGAGLNYYSYSDGRIHSIRGPENLRYIHSLCEVSADTLYAASVGEGIFKIILDWNSGPSIREVERIVFDGGLEAERFFFSMCREDDSTIWFGNRGCGAVRYDIPSGKYDVLTFDDGDRSGANDVFDIHKSKDGRIWFGTSAGLISLYRDRLSATGVVGTVHCILEDTEGRLYLSTNSGVSKYSPSSGNIVNYGYSYGLGTVEYSDGAAFNDEDSGTLFFGGINGIVAIRNTEYEEGTLNPPVMFRDVRLSDGSYSINEFISGKGGLVIDPDRTLHSVSILALDYVNGSNYSYFSRTGGRSDEWTETSPVLSLSGLPYGKYSIDVRYRNNLTGYESPVYSMPLWLKPPFYASSAAMVLYALAVLCMIAGVAVSLVIRYRRSKNERMKAFETRKKEEIYESKMNFFSNIIQEFSMPLTMISAPCEQIVNYPGADDYILGYAQTISKNVSKLHNFVYMLHKFREGGDESGSSEKIELVSVTDIAKRLMDSYEDYAEKKMIRHFIDVPDNLIWPVDQKGLTMILETLMSNAFNHTPLNGMVSVTIYKKDENLNISISNDSAVVNSDDIAAIFDRNKALDYFERKSERGLSFSGDLRLAVCHNIVTGMNGEIIVDSTPNALTTFTVRIPYLQVSSSDVAQPEAIVSMESTLAFAAPASGKKKYPFEKGRPAIFVVNENTEIMCFVADIFSSDYNVTMPDNFSDMENMLKQMHPDIVICDALSEKSEYQAIIRHIKDSKLTSHIPVVLLSSVQQIDERLKGVESGADICLAIPFNVEYLKAVVDQLLKRNRSLKEYYNSPISAYEVADGQILHHEDKKFIDDMVKIINENLTDTRISTKFIAEKMGLSIRNLYRRLEGLGCQSPAEIIKEYRLVKAEQLLTTTKLTIDEIIYKAGFANRGTFFKCFSAKYGCTPKAYRNEKVSRIEME